MTTESPHDEHGGALSFAGDFDAPTMDEWQAAVAKVLNRNRPEDKQLSPEASVARLRTTTVDGMEIEPIYTRDDAVAELGVPGAAPYTRGTTIRNGDMDAWDVRGLYEDPDAKRTHADIMTDLERGVTSLWLRLDPDAVSTADLGTVLADVYLDLAKVDVSSRTDQVAAAEALMTLCEHAQPAKETIAIGLGLDPIGFSALHGTTPVLDALAVYARRIADYRHGRAIAVDSTIWHNAGAGDIHEVAWAIATATEYARHLLDAGLTPDEAFDTINFRVTAACDEFLTIARIRALRTCWNRVGEVLGVSETHRGARQHAVTSWREITRDDPYVNILRGTISTFSAAIGGAEAVTVLPFDTAWGLPNDFSRRVARNTQLLLAEESNIGRVNDPSGGAWYVEHLSREIAEKAWAEFQRVESLGGMALFVTQRGFDEPLSALNAERTKRLSQRTKPVTGVSEFPKIDESPLDVIERPAAPARAGVAWHRDAEVFEALRDRAHGAEWFGATPQVFLACLGTRRDFGPREGFASNMFHIAALPTPECEGGTPEEIVAAWKATATPVVCLCSNAKVYAAQALTVAKALKEAGVSKVYLAGSLKELGDDAAEAESIIDGTVALGMDVVSTLTTVLDTLGVK